MEIEKRIKEFALYPQDIQRAFYDEKLEMLLAQHNQKQTPDIKEMLTSCNVETIESFFPDATIKKIGHYYDDLLVKLKNVDFHVSAHIKNKIVEIKKNIHWSPLYVDKIPNFIEYIKEVDRLMPEWEKEFADLRDTLGDKIKERQRNWVLKGKCSVARILEYRIESFLLENRENTGTGASLNKTLEEANISFENFSVIAKDNCIIIRVSDNCMKKFYYKEIGVEQLKQLDKMLPVWNDELDGWSIENKKLEMSKEVGDLGVTALVKKKMKSLGCEYHIKRNFKSMSLYIKIDRTCVLKLFLPYDSIDKIRNRLDSIDNVINGGKKYDMFRMSYWVESINWTREKMEI